MVGSLERIPELLLTCDVKVDMGVWGSLFVFSYQKKKNQTLC